MQKLAQRNKNLWEALNLSVKDVDANRQGNLSDTQFDRITKQIEVLWRRIGYLFVGMALPPIIVAILISAPVIRFAAVLLAFTSVFFFIQTLMKIAPRQRALRQDLDNQAVETVEGTASRELKNERDYFIMVNNIEFLVPESIYHLIGNGDLIAIYYLKESQKLLSIEFIEPFYEENMTV